jgi:hypothetical protein
MTVTWLEYAAKYNQSQREMGGMGCYDDKILMTCYVPTTAPHALSTTAPHAHDGIMMTCCVSTTAPHALSRSRVANRAASNRMMFRPNAWYASDDIPASMRCMYGRNSSSAAVGKLEKSECIQHKTYQKRTATIPSSAKHATSWPIF